MMLYSNAAELIGNTPVVELSRLTEGMPGTIYAKIEYANPGASKKDRIAKQIIDDARAEGRLSPGQPVVEVTSGNTGTGLAIVCACAGHPFIAVISAGNSIERCRMMQSLGAQVEVVPQTQGGVKGQVSREDLDLVDARCEELVKELGAFRPDQWYNDSNPNHHYRFTGAEIWADLAGRINAFCDFAGTGGTLIGVARRLKEEDPAIRCYAVEPDGAAFLAGQPVTNLKHRIQGGGYARPCRFWQDGLIDDYLAISDSHAQRAARMLAEREGLFAGYSSGANIAAALELLSRDEPGAPPTRVVCTLNDSGLKYMSTDLWP